MFPMWAAAKAEEQTFATVHTLGGTWPGVTVRRIR
jgi:hypothetical protein